MSSEGTHRREVVSLWCGSLPTTPSQPPWHTCHSNTHTCNLRSHLSDVMLAHIRTCWDLNLDLRLMQGMHPTVLEPKISRSEMIWQELLPSVLMFPTYYLSLYIPIPQWKDSVLQEWQLSYYLYDAAPNNDLSISLVWFLCCWNTWVADCDVAALQKSSSSRKVKYETFIRKKSVFILIHAYKSVWAHISKNIITWIACSH